MLMVKIEVDAPKWTAQGVKEHLAMCLERFGDVRVISVQFTGPNLLKEQLKLEGGP